jgi:phosphomannomutase
MPCAVAGIISAGSDVLDIGICPTPTVQLAVENRKARGGIAITASHNPAEWNALKLISRDGTFLAAGEVKRVVEQAGSDDLTYSTFESPGRIERGCRAVEEHVAGVLDLSYVDVERIRKRHLKVALDCVNGAGSLVAPDLLKRLGCEVYERDCQPTGDFRRNPEPASENIGGLCEMVRDARADIGFALDPDADRLAVVNELGRPIGEDYTLVICADVVLRSDKGPLVTNLSTSRAAEDVARQHGVEFYRVPIGEINVVTKMKQVGSTIGGEGNGGVILPALHYGRDSLVGMALVLEALAACGEPLSAMMNKFPQYGIFKTKTSIDESLDTDSLKTMLEKEFEGGRFNYEDGVRVEMGSTWLHVRKSGTEPVLRLIGEAETRRKAEELVKRAMGLLGS